MEDKKEGEEKQETPDISTLADLLRHYRDDMLKTITELEVKLKETGLVENEIYQVLKRTYQMHMEAMLTNPLAFINAVPAYYSFGYYIYGFLEGRGYSIKALIGDAEYKKWQESVDARGILQTWTEKIRQIEKDTTQLMNTAIQHHYDLISPPDPNNPPDPNSPPK
jgi:hypothetical protein